MAKEKKQVCEKSLANLQTEKYKFSKDNAEIAQENQKKSVAKRKENTLMREVAEKALLKKIQGREFQELSINSLLEYCLSPDANMETVIKILVFLRDTSGQKPTEEVQAVIMPAINIKGL